MERVVEELGRACADRRLPGDGAVIDDAPAGATTLLAGDEALWFPTYKQVERSMRTFASFAASALVIVSNPLAAQPLDPSALRQTMELITITAAQICGEYVREGRQWTVDVEGAVQAELRGLAGRLMELGIEGGANLTDADFTNVLQHQLADELSDVRQCRQKIWDDTVAAVFQNVSGTTSREVDLDLPETGAAAPDEEANQVQTRATPPVVAPGHIFSIFERETLALNDPLTLLTLDAIESNGRFAAFILAKLDAGRSDHVRVAHGNVFTIRNSECNLTLYGLDEALKSAELILFCPQ